MSGLRRRRSSRCISCRMRLRIKTDGGESHGFRQQMRPCLVVAPHPWADAQRFCGFGLGHLMARAPFPQPRTSLLKSEPPQGIGGDFEVVRPVDAPPPFTDHDAAEKIIIASQRSKYGIF